MTASDFVCEIESLYGEFTSEGMKMAVLKKLTQISEKNISKLFDTYCRTIPGIYKPDLKNVLDCMEKACIKQDEYVKQCLSCGHKWTSTQVSCPYCGYDKTCGDPEEYKRDIESGIGQFNREAFAEFLKKWNQKSLVRMS